MVPDFINQRIQQRISNGNIRQLKSITGEDFVSNDYLGLATNRELTKQAISIWQKEMQSQSSVKASRLLGGNAGFFEKLEVEIAQFHNAESALLFPSGYLANLAFFSALQERSATILFDEMAHASVRDGMRLSHCRSYHFKHNDFNHLEKLLQKSQTPCFVYVEAVYSMLGDSPDAEALNVLCKKYNAALIVDEAHSGGVFGNMGSGWACENGLDVLCFARIFTYGKAFGVTGGAILGNYTLKKFLINFSSPFIYSTGLLPVQAALIKSAYNSISNANNARQQLNKNIQIFETQAGVPKTNRYIRSVLLKNLPSAADYLAALSTNKFCVHVVKPPTVPIGMDMLRLNIHSFNTIESIKKIAKLLYG